jgi:BirA family biotin operon repressor/biotin-[acetyl-CoA-carboxylase] ligase
MIGDRLQIMKDELLSASAITHGLETSVLGRHVEYYGRVDSTNDVAHRLADAGAVDGTLVIADEQTAGRGRMGRFWTSPPRSSILMSLILRPRSLAPHQIARVTMATALGCCDGIRAAIGLETQIKWPNDILLRGKKCAGVLTETRCIGEQIEYVIVGLGLNVNFSATAVNEIPTDATTLLDELRKETPRAPLVQAILQRVEDYYLRVRAGHNLHKEWAARLTTLGQSVRAQAPEGIDEGIAESVDEDGALRIRRADGSLVRLIAGDVTLSPRV